MTYPPLRLKGIPFEFERDLLPIIPRNIRIVSSGVKSSLRWLPVWESATRRPTPFAVIRGLAIQNSSPKLFDLHRSLIMARFAQLVAPSVRPATTSLVQTKSITIKHLTYFFSMTNGREITPPGFSTLTPIPGPNANELPPITTSTFTTKTPKNTPLAYRASTSANPDPTTSPTFVKTNYEVLKSLLKERGIPMRNEDLRTELEYLSEEYDEERDESMVEMNSEGGRTSEQRAEDSRNQGINLPPLLAAHLGRNKNGQPLQSSLTSIHEGHQPSTNVGGISLLTKWEMPVACHMFTYTLKDSVRIWWNCQKAGSILNYEDLKEKFRSHFGQQKKFTKTHLAAHNIKQKEGESTRAFVTRYTNDTLQILGLHEEQRIFGFVHGLKTRSLMEFLSTDLQLLIRV
ncbi:reverse transcriptase domain-containing protein [Tanacetum coccineum]|uniref:Reverse transcriptase domain-containing protein n=1 Tax=Tanacetum coccineum TaxID=301880 RepID=A0ABQ5GMF7_9ASTR